MALFVVFLTKVPTEVNWVFPERGKSVNYVYSHPKMLQAATLLDLDSVLPEA